ncbi:hypothetical protein Tco_0926514 [Tanacetum coccineum]|uniref:Transposase-associated domain-containing protein n=1 Tax=Tanacetum coccineum TaxID=301880 RepID=A0ABQ5DA12_9ASTR
MILCPCADCYNRFHLERAKVYDNLICVGFKRGYLNWMDHEESNEKYGEREQERETKQEREREPEHDFNHEKKNDKKIFDDLVKDVDQKFLQEELLPHWNILPKKHNENGNENKEVCSFCNASRWRPNQKDNSRDESGYKSGDDAVIQDEAQRVKDGKLRHPTDALSWKHFDEKHPEFASDHQNVHLALTMKQPNFILSLIILGLEIPNNKAFDVYMQPLIKELKELWVWSTKGEYACPICAFDKTSKWLNHVRKWCYMGHRRCLEPNHSSRKDTRSFDGHQELRQPPILASGDDILDQLKGVGFLSENVEKSPWKKKSILFTLRYWKNMLLLHNLDVMHIEKNVLSQIQTTSQQ